MAGNQLAVLRENLVYFGWAKQSSWNTGVAPTQFWRWLDGSDAQPQTKFAQEREGDGSPHISLVYKQGEYFVIKIKEKVRARTAGCAIQALLGAGSDTYTAPAKSTTLSGAGNTAGATAVVLVGDLGNTGTLALNINPGFATATYEVVTIDCTTRSGVGPYTYSIAASGTLKNGHSAAEAVTSASTHALTRASSSYDPYCIEVGYGASGTAPFDAFRYIDAVCVEVKLTHQAGAYLVLEHTWYARQEQRQGALTATAFESGAGFNPYLWHMASGTWNLDGSTGNNAVGIQSLVLDLKNTTSPEDLMAETLNPIFFTPDNFQAQCQVAFIFTSWDQYYETYYGNTKSPAAPSTDSYLVGVGNLAATYTLDAVNSLAISIPNGSYTAANKPKPALTGRSMKQQLTMTPTKTAAVANPVTLTLTNSQNSAY